MSWFCEPNIAVVSGADLRIAGEHLVLGGICNVASAYPLAHQPAHSPQQERALANQASRLFMIIGSIPLPVVCCVVTIGFAPICGFMTPCITSYAKPPVDPRRRGGNHHNEKQPVSQHEWRIICPIVKLLICYELRFVEQRPARPPVPEGLISRLHVIHLVTNAVTHR